MGDILMSQSLNERHKNERKEDTKMTTTTNHTVSQWLKEYNNAWKSKCKGKTIQSVTKNERR